MNKLNLKSLIYYYIIIIYANKSLSFFVKFTYSIKLQ